MSPFGKSLLVLGGARSGKSRYAQAQVEQIDGPLTFIATAQALDDEMSAKIARHRADRGERWHTIEAPLDLAGAVHEAQQGNAILIDCLTLWASNLLLSNIYPAPRIDALIRAIHDTEVPIALVSNEVGLGIVPDNALAREFRDLAGDINQRVAGVVERAEFLVAGLRVPLAR